mgnify:CR=1 FL=1|tara:strand:+ start:2785 stop:3684 length:900 start_codon:yes stop_codon:yes gene_type:complete
MKFINWPRSTLMRFAYMMPEIIAGQTGTVVNTAGLHELNMAPFAYWDATFQGWLELEFKNSGKNRMLELIREYGGPSQLYYGIMDTQGLEMLMTRSEWKGQEKYWLQYCIDNGKWPFSVWLVPEDITVLEDIADNNLVTKLIDKMRFQPVQQHTLNGWMTLNPAEHGYTEDKAWEKIGGTGFQYALIIDGYDPAELDGSNRAANAEQKKMEFLFPWNLQMQKIEELTVQSYESVINDYLKARGKNSLKDVKGKVEWKKMNWDVRPDEEDRNIHSIYLQILQEYEQAKGKLVGFQPYPEI